MVRVVLDTNVYVSSLISKRGVCNKIIKLWNSGVLLAFTSEQILSEIEKTLNKPYLYKHHKLNGFKIKKYVEYLREFSILTPGAKLVKVVKDDPTDDKFIICAIEANANYLVSGDKHLKRIGEYQNISIVSPGEFWDIIKGIP